MGEVDAFEDHCQPRAGDLDGLGICCASRKAKGADFEPLIPDGKAVAIPIQNLHERVLAVEKNEEMVGERIGFERIANDAEQSIEGFTHVDGRSAEGNASVR